MFQGEALTEGWGRFIGAGWQGLMMQPTENIPNHTKLLLVAVEDPDEPGDPQQLAKFQQSQD